MTGGKIIIASSQFCFNTLKKQGEYRLRKSLLCAINPTLSKGKNENRKGLVSAGIHP